MKLTSIIKSMTGIIMVSLLCFSCSKEKIMLGYDLKEGTKYFSELSGNMKMKQEMNAMKIAVDIDMLYQTHSELVSKTEKDFTINLVIDSMDMAMEMDQNGKKSTLKDFPGGDALQNIFQIFKGQFLTITMTQSGETVKVDGFQRWMKNIVDYMEKEYGDVNPQMNRQLEEMYGQKMYQDHMQKMFVRFPAMEVGVGDQWYDTLDFTAFFPMQVVTTYQLKSFSDEEAVISSTTLIKMGGDDIVIDEQKLPMKLDLGGELDSQYTIHRQSGWTIKGKMDYTFGGNILIEAQSPNTQSQNIPIDFTGYYELKGNIE